MRIQGLIPAFVIGGFVAGFSWGQTNTSRAISISGKGSLELGQLVDYQFRGADHRRAWLSQTKVQVTARKMITPWLNVALGIEGSAWYETYDAFSNNPFVVPDQFFSFILHQSEAEISWGELLHMELGLFPYKYNPDVRNLGEYVFRSGAYPGFLIGEFDFPLARLTGVRLSNHLFGTLDQNLLLTLETQYKPFHDASLTYLAAYTPHPCATIGGGISFSHLISVNENRTTPKTDGAWYIEDPDTLRNALGTDSLILGDTAYLTFRGIKIMARFCFDVKKFFSISAFGPEDFKLYGEAAVLGLKNYQLYYDTLAQRIPVMAGFNVPAFKLLDVFSLEAEWYGSPYPNNFWNAFSIQPEPRPIPVVTSSGYPASAYRKDDWKWSVFARKTFAYSLSITTQFARDHFRTRANNPYNVEREESLTKDEHWYWMIKFAYGF